ncbi:alpha/beta fold hydrolase [Halogranum rubrum]|uniref:AB hydrolase-1 domain-containing protein n=1 Tax=Halogranum salarium B-1 TaxID=1210908 RepID=J3A357_9EURY|nr:alpha/beta fold hydrolase [Halogranum salarium]EJN59778.1 hypothetical protein HSB1_19360 [Halogranum salarium B-1]
MSTPALDRPEWLDTDRYPFASNYVDCPEGRLHYVDEGDGDPIVFLHGNPTWSFLYRHLVSGLSDSYRCIAPDYLGFGLSDKPEDFSYRPEDHARVVARFLDELELTDVTFVVQDWGGPIGLDYATRHPENVRALVVLNTWMWPVEHDRRTRLFSRAFDNPVGKRLVTRHNGFARWVMPLVYGDRSKLTPEIHRHYLEPLSTSTERLGSWLFPREILGSSDWLRALWSRREAITDTPVCLLWGTQDPAFGPAFLDRWQRLFPDAPTVAYDDAGHYLQEEKGPELATEIRSFLSSLEE